MLLPVAALTTTILLKLRLYLSGKAMPSVRRVMVIAEAADVEAVPLLSENV
jgi:hypothetical protein